MNRPSYRVASVANSAASPDAAAPRGRLFGLPVDTMDFAQTLGRLESLVDAGGTHVVQGLNAHTVLLADKDPALAAALGQTAVTTLDGMSCVWAARLAGLQVRERVCGVDLMPAILRLAVGRGWSCYLLGGTPRVARHLARSLVSEYPGLAVAGYHDGYFAEADAAVVADRVAVASPTVVFVGMPSPKKELFAAEFGARMGAQLVVGVGGSFDVLAGLRRRAPRWARGIGLEWMFRMIQEPRRLIIRYLIGNPRFLALAGRGLLTGSIRR